MVYLMQFYKWTTNISDFLFSVCIYQKIFYLFILKLNCYSYFILSTLFNFLTWNSTSRWRKGRQLSLNLYTKKLFNFYQFFCPKKTHNLFKNNACDFFLLYDHVNINVNVNININACRLWGTGYGFLIVCGIPMFVALWLAHKCTSPRTNIVWLNLSWYMYMIFQKYCKIHNIGGLTTFSSATELFLYSDWLVCSIWMEGSSCLKQKL